MFLYAQLFVLIFVALLAVVLGFWHDFFITVWWWDIPTHFFSGTWVGFFGLWFFEHWKRKLSILECALAAFVVGLGWEVFEHLMGIGGSVFMSYWIDTIKDLIVDSLGGALAGILARRMKL